MKRKERKQNCLTWIIFCIITSVSLLSSCKKEMESRSRMEDLEQESVQLHKFMIDGQEVVVEEKNGEFYYDHDILLSIGQMNKLRKWDGTTSTEDRGAVLVKGEFTKLWPNKTLIYDINFLDERGDSSKLATLKKNVAEAMRRVTAKTGFAFRQRSEETNYVKFISHATDNNSMIGMIGGEQKIRISYEWSVGTIMHELLHAMGISHEQSRADRDEYIYNEGTSGDWGINTQMIGPFNASSLMLYSVRFKPDSLYQYSPQFSDTLSKGDVLTINFLYPKDLADGKIYRMYSKKNAQWVLEGNVGGSISISKDNNTVNGQRWSLQSVSDSSYVIRSGIDHNLVLIANDSTSLKFVPFDVNMPFSQQFVIARTEGNRYQTLMSMRYPGRVVSANNRTTRVKGRDLIKAVLDKRINNNEFQEFVLVENEE